MSEVLERNEVLEGVNDNDSDNDGFSLDDILSSEEEVVAPVSLEQDHLILPRKALASFLKFCSLYSKSSTDVYSKSFHLSRLDAENVVLTYSNGTVLAKKTIKTIINENQLLGKFIFSFESFTKALASAVSQLIIVEEDGKVYGHLYGGQFFIETQTVSDTIYNDSDLGEERETITVNLVHYLALLKSLLALSVSGGTATERAVYFEQDAAYIYSGPAVGKFPGNFMKMALQNIDVNSVITFFEDAKDDIKITIYDNYVKFSSGADYIVLSKKNLSLASDVKQRSFDVPSGVNVDPQTLYRIINLLLSSPSGFTSAKLEQSDFGIKVVSNARTGDVRSTFPVYGSKESGGLSQSGVSISLKTFKSYIGAFASNVLLNIGEDMLYIKGDIGSVIIKGISN